MGRHGYFQVGFGFRLNFTHIKQLYCFVDESNQQKTEKEWQDYLVDESDYEFKKMFDHLQVKYPSLFFPFDDEDFCRSKNWEYSFARDSFDSIKVVVNLHELGSFESIGGSKDFYYEPINFNQQEIEQHFKPQFDAFISETKLQAETIPL